MTQINIASVNEGGPGRKYGTLKTAEGATYMLPVGLNGVFQPGATVDVPVKQETWKDKRSGLEELKHIINGRPGAAGSGAIAQPVPQPPPPRPLPPPLPPPTPHPGNGTARQSNLDGKDLFIFVTGVVGRAMGSGQFGVTDIDLLTKAAIAAYKDNVA